MMLSVLISGMFDKWEWVWNFFIQSEIKEKKFPQRHVSNLFNHFKPTFETVIIYKDDALLTYFDNADQLCIHSRVYCEELLLYTTLYNLSQFWGRGASKERLKILIEIIIKK